MIINMKSKTVKVLLAVGGILALGGIIQLYRREHPTFTEEQRALLIEFNRAVFEALDQQTISMPNTVGG